MKIIYKIALLAFGISNILNAQCVELEWASGYLTQRAYDSHAEDFAIDNSGNSYLTGYMFEWVGQYSNPNYYTVKFYSDGAFAWDAIYDGPTLGPNTVDRAYALTVDGTGNVYVTGQGDSCGTDPYIHKARCVTLKYNAFGSLVDSARYDSCYVPGGEETGLDIIACAGNIYVASIGGYYSGGVTRDDIVLITYSGGLGLLNSNRNNFWNQAPIELAARVGAIYLVIATHGIRLNKYNLGGGLIWTRVLNEDYAEIPTGLAIDNSDNAFIVGTYGSGEGIDGAYDFYTAKYSPDGDLAWTATWDGPTTNYDFDKATDAAVDNNGFIYVVGNVGGSGNLVTIKYNPDGDTLWTRIRGINTFAHPACIALDDSGNVYVAASDQYHILVTKYDPNGNTKWDYSHYSTSCFGISHIGIGVDANYKVYVGGIESCQDGHLFAVIKLNQLDYGAIRCFVTEADGITPIGGAQVLALHGYDTLAFIPMERPGQYFLGNLCEGTYQIICSKENYLSQILSDVEVYYGDTTHVEIQLYPVPIQVRLWWSQSNLITNNVCNFYRIDNDPPVFTETYIGQLTTDNSGWVSLPYGWFEPGDIIKVSRVIYTEPRRKSQAILSNMYNLIIDNMQTDEYGDVSYYTLSNALQYNLYLEHETALYDLVVSIEWDADEQYLESLEQGLRYLSNYLYDISDGHLSLDSIKVFDNSDYWDSSDLKIYASNIIWPQANAIGSQYPEGGGIMSFSANTNIYFPRIFLSNVVDCNRNLSYSNFPYDWTTSLIDCGGVCREYPAVRTLAHEFGHYALGFLDEYQDVRGNIICPDRNFGLMDDQLECNDPHSSEMSTWLWGTWWQTEQLVKRGTTCWSYFGRKHNRVCDDGSFGVPDPANFMLEGPNNDLENVNFDIGAHSKVIAFDSNTGAFTKSIYATDRNGNPLGGMHVWVFLLKNNRNNTVWEGATSDGGLIRCIGVNLGDVIRLSAKADGNYLIGEISVTNPILSGRTYVDNVVIADESDSVNVLLQPVQGDYNMLFMPEYISTNSLDLFISFNRLLDNCPTIELFNSKGQHYNYNMTPNQNGFTVSISDSLYDEGYFCLNAIDDSSNAVFAFAPYRAYQAAEGTSYQEEIYSRDGNCVIYLDTLNTNIPQVMILSSNFPAVTTGLDSIVVQEGLIYSVCSFPAQANLLGVNNINIRYTESNLGDIPEFDLAIYKWDNGIGQWSYINSYADTTNDIIKAQINELGIFGLFTKPQGYFYLPGDANMANGTWPPAVIGSDVTYLVNYFRGIETNPACLINGFYAAADVNGDCHVIGSDVTRLVNYFRGQGIIEPCPDYPPAWLTPADCPDEAPTGWPNCE